MAALYVLKGPDEGKRFELADDVIGIGRDANNGVWLHDTEVSRRHAELRVQPNGSHQLVDLASSNGTFVNSQQVQTATLQPGDQIEIGQSLLVYVAATDLSRKGELAGRIAVLAKAGRDVPSAIVRSVGEAEASKLLVRPDQAEGPWLKNALASLSVMYQTTQAISHILDVDQLLERIMDLILDSIPAERGCIITRLGESGAFEPKVVRYRNRAELGEQINISRTITDYVLKEQKGVLVTDAGRDERFAPAESVQRYGIREALCVPMKGRHETVGVIYLDTRTPALPPTGDETTQALNEDHLLLAVAIAHQAALAVEETRYHQAMVQAERLAAIGQTVAAISHHIKNILQGLRSGGDLIKMGLDDGNTNLTRQGWSIVEKNQGRIYDLVMDMLSFSKEREPLLEPTDLNQLVKEVLELAMGRLTDPRVRLEVKLDERLQPVLVDSEGLHRALLNVVANALDAMTDTEEPKLLVQTLLENDGQWVQIAVTDNGAGIPPEKRELIFRPFVSTKGSKGTGLGLTVSRKILREHGGDILVQSQPKQGSRFTLRVPIAAGPQGEAARKTILALESPHSEPPP